MAQDSSLGATLQFDFSTPAGVLSFLAAVRASELDSSVKNELRDLVLLYTNGGRDGSVRLSLEQKIATYKLTPPAPAPVPDPVAPPAPAVVLPFGSVRHAPSFTYTPSFRSATSTQPLVQRVTQSVDTSISAPVLVPDVAQQPVSPQSVPVESGPASLENIPFEKETIVTPKAAEVVVPPAPAQEPLPTIAPAPEPIIEVSIPSNVHSEPTATRQSQTPEQLLARIREIKSAVNEKVGNPVNLVDIDNAIGREYMSALLDAMKQIGGGSSGTNAMARLERAFEAVQELLRTRGTAAPAKPEINASAAPAAPVVSKAVPLSDSVAPSPNNVDSHTENQVSSERVVTTPDPVPQARVVVEPIMPPSPAYDTTPPPESPTQTPSPSPVPNTPPPSPAPNPNMAASATVSAAPIIRPLSAESVPLRTPADLPDPASLATASVVGDQLYTKEVDDGLEQLLSEWSLFKKSGLFGTGPRGREHPLFKKLAGLQIPLLLAGRFEGATQEIKQSVTDYMNGWRYEQGIIYEQGETFEHYLRRVIHHIIDLQKRRIGAV